MKLSDTPDDQREGHVAYIGKRWSQLAELELSWSSDAIKYLLLVNSGAAVAVLTFMGTSESIRNLRWPKVMLVAFVIGLMLIGVYQAARYHRIDHIYRNWRHDVNLYYQDKLDWDDMISSDEDRSKRSCLRLLFVLAYLSFFCFLLGAGVGACNFLAS